MVTFEDFSLSTIRLVGLRVESFELQTERARVGLKRKGERTMNRELSQGVQG